MFASRTERTPEVKSKMSPEHDDSGYDALDSAKKVQDESSLKKQKQNCNAEKNLFKELFNLQSNNDTFWVSTSNYLMVVVMVASVCYMMTMGALILEDQDGDQNLAAVKLGGKRAAIQFYYDALEASKLDTIITSEDIAIGAEDDVVPGPGDAKVEQTIKDNVESKLVDQKEHSDDIMPNESEDLTDDELKSANGLFNDDLDESRSSVEVMQDLEIDQLIANVEIVLSKLNDDQMEKLQVVLELHYAKQHEERDQKLGELVSEDKRIEELVKLVLVLEEKGAVIDLRDE
eukprot:GFUD01005539.1.p1 GENE.GFUD01005539.1~~GFUD01005539.1.p1  ORF type:complete len:314 (-),score=79.80 GFUD01005539.1:111-977(-)